MMMGNPRICKMLNDASCQIRFFGGLVAYSVNTFLAQDCNENNEVSFSFQQIFFFCFYSSQKNLIVYSYSCFL